MSTAIMSTNWSILFDKTLAEYVQQYSKAYGDIASVAAAPANRRLEPEPEPAPIRAEPSPIWSSRHFSQLPLSRLGPAKPAKPPFFCSCPSPHPPILSFPHNFLSSQVTEAFHRTFK